MRAVVQRVKSASVRVGDKVVGQIGKGILLLLGIGKDDSDKDLKWVADKVVNLRIFEDDDGKMNLSLLDIKGDLLVVSQFTLYGDARKGRRPSFTDAASPDKGEDMYKKFVDYIKSRYNLRTKTGEFGAKMDVHLVNWGPVTILIDSKKVF